MIGKRTRQVSKQPVLTYLGDKYPFSQHLYLEFVIVILGAVFGLLYHLKFTKAIFFSPKSNGTIEINTKLYGLTTIIIFQMVTIIYVKDIANLAGYTESVIIGI